MNCIAFPLTPALSLGERENCFQFLGDTTTVFCSTAIRTSANGQRLSPLPRGEGQGEGERETQMIERACAHHGKPHLTPALSAPSDGAEREKRSQRLGKTIAGFCSTACGFYKIGQQLFPLPAGEGQGEGELFKHPATKLFSTKSIA